MKLGIAIAPLNKTNSAKNVLDKIHLLEELLNRRFDFIEGINNPSIMYELIKHYPCYTLGSLIPRTDIDIVEQFMNACYLAKELNIKYLMFGNQKVREYVAEGKYKLNLQQLYTGMFGACSHLGLELMFEPLKGTYPSTLSEVVRLQNMYNVSSMHICLKNTDINSDILDIVMPNTIQNCHISLALYLKYYESIKHLDRVTLEI